MRKFWIEREDGERWPLNNERGVWLSNPSGLGARPAPKFSAQGYGFYALTKNDDDPQGSVPFDLVFKGAEPYEIYREFCDWLLGYDGQLWLIYRPYGTVEHRRSVTLEYLQKTEMAGPTYLRCPSALLALTPWTREQTGQSSAVIELPEMTTQYDYCYEDGLRWPGNASDALEVAVAPAGHIPTAVTIVYTGVMENPVITASGRFSGVLGACRIQASFEAGESLEWSSRHDGAYVRKVTASGEVVDLSYAIDLTAEPFPRLPVGEDCTVRLAADNELVNEMSWTIHRYYRTV